MYELIAPEIIANGIGIVTHVLRKCYNQVYGGCKCIAVTAAELWDIVRALASSWHHFERDVCVRIAPDFAAWRLRGAEYDLCGGGDNMPVDWAICSIAADCAAARDFGRWLVSGCEQYEHNEHVRFEPIFAAWRSIGAARGQFRGRANRAQASRQLQLLTTFALAECALQPPVQSRHRRRHSAALAALAAHSTAALCRLGRRARRFVPFRAEATRRAAHWPRMRAGSVLRVCCSKGVDRLLLPCLLSACSCRVCRAGASPRISPVTLITVQSSEFQCCSYM